MHSDFRFEVAHLKKTQVILSEELDKSQASLEMHQTRIEKLQKSSSGYDDELQVALNVTRSVRTYTEALAKAQDRPYFGRIDFNRDDENIMRAYYIGKTGVLEKDTKDPVIVDWRAPIASLYYGGELGEAMYVAPEGVVFGDMPLKRQFQIEAGELLHVFDKNIAPVDEFLNLELSKSKDNKLSDIVSTIQSEQNQIIRHDKDKCVIVQGVAGSGKTTIVLHRLAYLLYNHQDVLKPEQVLMVMPNKLFLDYVSDVLPDLGVHHIEQTTFNDLARSLVGTLHLQPDLMIETFFEGEGEHRALQAVANLKSWAFMSFLDKEFVRLKNQYCEAIASGVAAFKLDATPYLQIFNEDYRYLPLFKRLPKVLDALQKAMDERWRKYEDANKAKMLASLDGLAKESPKRRQAFDAFEQKMAQDQLLLKHKIETFKNTLKHPSSMVLLEEAINKFAPESGLDLVSGAKNEINEILIGQYLYVYSQLEGLQSPKNYAHIVVDEAQDLNIFQYHLLKQLNRSHVFTIVGDLNQGIRQYKGIDTWQDIYDLAPSHKRAYETIETCYRSTRQIVEMANTCLSQLSTVPVYPKPVIREGHEPLHFEVTEMSGVIDIIASQLGMLKSAHSVAILTPDQKSAMALKPLVEKATGAAVHLIDANTEVYEGGWSIMPIYQAKGLEFDAVVLVKRPHEKLTDLHHKMHYVAMTRALHELTIITLTDKT